VQEGNVSEKEQAEALKLLVEVTKRFREKPLDAADLALLEKVDLFLVLPVAEQPESHGHRRS
jgi:hypothetical protein